VARPFARRYRNPQEKRFHIFSAGDLAYHQHYPLRIILGMVPSVIRTTICAFLGACLCASWFACGSAAEPVTVRVAILRDAVMARVSVQGYYRIEDAATHQALAEGKDLKGAITAFKYAVNINGRRYPQSRLYLRPQDSGSIEVNGRRYPGDLEIIRGRGSAVLVNHVGLEDYVKGIAVREISHYWPFEALLAHAIVFRTYALYAVQQNAKRDYDVTGDVYSQVYGGAAAERYRISDACDQTSGDVLTCGGRIFPAYYHSTCGGHTQNASILWNIDIPALSGVDCVYCKGSPHFSWNAAIPVAEAVGKLSAAGIMADGITAIETSDIDQSGRVVKLALRTARGGFVEIAGKDFRQILGNDIVKSTNFDVVLRGRMIEFSGRGWGHGVGLCQWGAYFMAKAGYSFSDILAYYYPGSEVRNINTYGIR